VDSLLANVQYVSLEVTEESIIGNIDEILVTNEHIFILDIYQTASIYIFNRAGKFLRKIHRPGKGPGEYTQPADIAIDQTTSVLHLLNEFPQKIIKYNLQGQYKGEIALPIRFRSFSLDNEGDIVLINEPFCRNHGNPAGHPNEIYSTLYIMTSQGERIEAGNEINRVYEENAISHSNFGLMKNQNITYHPLFNDTIFELVGSLATPVLTVDFGNHKINEREVNRLSMNYFLKICAKKNYYYINGQHCQTPMFLSFYVYSSKQKKNYYVIYNKESREGMVFYNSRSSIFNPCNFIPITSWQDQFVSVVSVSKLLEMKYGLDKVSEIPTETLKFSPTHNFLDRIDENSNPVLAFYKLRPEKINMESVFLAEE